LSKFVYRDLADYIDSTRMNVTQAFRMGWNTARLEKKHPINVNEVPELSGDYHKDCNTLINEIIEMRKKISIYENILYEDTLKKEIKGDKS